MHSEPGRPGGAADGRHATIHALVREQARRTPAAPAVWAPDGELDHAELVLCAKGLARRLAGVGLDAGPDTPPDTPIVGVCVERSLELPVALLGVLEAGAAYLPLDPAYPEQRLAHMLRDSGAAAVALLKNPDAPPTLRFYTWRPDTLSLGYFQRVEDVPAAQQARSTGMCLHRSTALDLVWDDKKGVGSAQRRKRGRVLHHGSIKLGPSRLEEGIATVGSPTRRVSAEELVPLLRAVFEIHLGIKLEAGVPERDERELARELGERAISPGFVRRR